jgi:hypothetical protein
MFDILLVKISVVGSENVKDGLIMEAVLELILNRLEK